MNSQTEMIKELISENENLSATDMSDVIYKKYRMRVSNSSIGAYRANMTNSKNKSHTPVEKTLRQDNIIINDNDSGYDAYADKEYNSKKSFGKRIKNKKGETTGYHYNIVI